MNTRKAMIISYHSWTLTMPGLFKSLLAIPLEARAVISVHQHWLPTMLIFLSILIPWKLAKLHSNRRKMRRQNQKYRRSALTKLSGSKIQRLRVFWREILPRDKFCSNLRAMNLMMAPTKSRCSARASLVGRRIPALMMRSTIHMMNWAKVMMIIRLSQWERGILNSSFKLRMRTLREHSLRAIWTLMLWRTARKLRRRTSLETKEWI